MEFETKNKDRKKNKSVLLFSGGMDSLIFNYLLKPDILLHFNYGGKAYGDIEKRKLQQLVDKKIIDKNKLIEKDLGNWLGDLERDDLILPSRNSYFVIYAANFGETIYLGSIFGDRSTDKDKEFYERTEGLLNHMYEESHWCEGRKFNVTSPFKDLTKTELIKKFLDKKGEPQWLLDSYSCYSGGEIPCSECKPCYRKAVSLFNNNININGYFNLEKLKNNKEILNLKNEIIKGKYRGREDKEICNFMEWKFIGDNK